MPLCACVLWTCSQYYNPSTCEHLVSFPGEGSKPLNLSVIEWELLDRHQLQPQKKQQQQQEAGKPPAAAAAAHNEHKAHNAGAAAAAPRVNPFIVSTEPPPEGMVCPTPNITTLNRQRIRVWWPDDKAWYAGEVTVSSV